MQTDRIDRAGLAACLASVVIWQAGLILQKTMVEGTNAASLMLVQIGCATMIMWAALLCSGRRPALSRGTALNVTWGMLAPGAAIALGIAGAARIDGVSIALIWGLFPLLGPFLSRLVLGEPLHWTFPAGGLLGFGGLAVIVTDRNSAGHFDMVGNLLVFASVCCSAVSSVIARFVNRGRNAWFSAATLQLTGATLTGLMIVPLAGWFPPDISSASRLLAISYLICVMTVLNYVAFNFALSRLPVSWVGLTGALAPVVGLAMAAFLLGSEIGVREILSAIVILLGVALPYLHGLSRSRKTRAESAGV